ncbi:uncharacterized protein PgNI_07167 [Pyricularia grisea]|uniref:WSC domain-containing protein n=1 Tax=Pyricularia grisea TaxID=148305 RepID=A0A6P8B2A0_PYRGI|nr:uncharacterized protein PgNI_07167 [Pyricularia grisea]TLD08976.1 hypothetical protein PgNI_07167 [Pyricularia grisea]
MASRFFVRALTAISAVVGLGECYAPTDYITWGGDNSRNGYRSNHNLDPAIVASPQFQQIFATALPGNYGGVKEQFYSMPLVFTPGDDPEGRQFLYVSTTQNNVYKLDAVTGEIVASRNLAIPFLTLDLKGTEETCADIDPHVGIIGTGVIDPVTETLYVIVKTYADQSKVNEVQGRPAGRHNIHALSLADLSERPSFPINFENLPARNNPTRLFQGGIHNQRPGLLQQGQNIYAGFGSHCVNYNITGWVIGFDKTSGKIIENFATQGEGVSAKGASIWMSGGGIAADDKGSVFYSTGNGYESQLSTIPVEGRNPPTALEEAVVHMTIQEDGKLKPVDFFMPEEKQILDGNDQDLGTSPFVLLPSEFSCGSVKRIGVVTGKTGWTYWLNMDDLGGYRTNGISKPEGERDRVLYKYKQRNSVYSGAGVYPHEGGYVHINPIGFPTTVFKFTCANNAPTFTFVGESVEANTGRLGPSHGAVTSLNGQPGTGLLWTTDVDNPGPSKWHFKIHEAIPGADGKMKLVKGFQVTGIRKFTRPIFGNGRVYVPAGGGMIYGFGAPTKPALNCTGSSSFGVVEIGMEAAEQVITCTAKIPVTVANMTLESPDFSVADTPSIPRTVATGSSFTFKARFKPTSVGNLTSSVRITTQNTDATNSYSIASSVALSGQGQSSAALLALQPKSLTFSPVGVGHESMSLSLTLTNQGKAPLTIQSVGYSTGPTGPWDSTSSGKFTVSDIPATIAPETIQVASVTFSPSELGNFTLYVQFATNGGTVVLPISATTGNPAVAVIQWEKPDNSGWETWTPNGTLSFGNITQNSEKRLRLRISNGGGPGAVALEVPISKPPFGTGGLIGAANQADLAEGTRIETGQYAEAVLICHAPKTNWNVDSKYERAAWVFNFNDNDMAKLTLPFDCTAVAQQGGPLKANGDGVYRYVSCYRENTPGRQLAQQVMASNAMTTDMCLNACAAKGYVFCGTQYHRECWGGNTVPNTAAGEENCNFDCSGDVNQWCGGNGEGAGSGNAHISLFATNTTLPPAPGAPSTNPGVNGYSSIGCYTEATSGRALPYGNTGNVRTVAACVSACSAKNYRYAGLQYGGECWCAGDMASSALPAPISECSMTCRDNSTEFCGGNSRNNVYLRDGSNPGTTALPTATGTTTTSSAAVSTASTAVSSSPAATGSPVPKARVGSFAYQGCYTENTGAGRALNAKSYFDDVMTLEACASQCSGFTYFGVEYGRECYCSNGLNGDSRLDTTSGACNFLCPGDKSTFCGAGNRISLYKLDASSSVTSGTSTVASSSASSTAAASTAASLSATASSASNSASSTYSNSTSALQSSTTVSGTTALASLTSSALTTALASSSAASSTLAASSSLSSATSKADETIADVTSSSSIAGSSTSPSASSSSTTSASASSSLTSSSTTPSTSQSASSSVASSTSQSTQASTTTTATSSVLGSTSITPSTSQSPNTSAASSASSSSAAPTTTLTASTTASSSLSSTAVPPQSTLTPPLWPGNVNFTYYGCVKEPSSGKLLTKQYLNVPDMTHDKCLETCWMFRYAGLEYGRECWCSDQVNWLGNSGATPGYNTTGASCDISCGGDTTLPAANRTKCGGRSLMTLFYLDPSKKKS